MVTLDEIIAVSYFAWHKLDPFTKNRFVKFASMYTEEHTSGGSYADSSSQGNQFMQQTPNLHHRGPGRPRKQETLLQ